MEFRGIDVSKWQGKIDWKKVKDAGAQFAILRAGYGRAISQIDPFFYANYEACKAIGLPVGAYWYSYATDTDDARREAATCLEAIKGKSFEYPVWFDQEYEPGIKALTDQPYALTWNATGHQECQSWTLENLTALAFAIDARVTSLVSYQQAQEVSMQAAAALEELEAIPVDYDSVPLPGGGAA